MSGAGAVARPRGSFPQLLPLLGGAALLLLVAVLTILGRPDGGAPASRLGARPVASVDLRFEDRADGAVVVRRAGEGGETVAVLAPGEDGFMRATMRGLARERLRGDLGPEAPFRLSAWPDGGLILEDLATRRALDLRAFGATQVEAFARLLPPAAKEERR